MVFLRLSGQDANGNNSVTNGQTTKTYPGGTTAGNLLIAAYQSGAASATAASLTGWTQVGGANVPLNNASATLACFYKIADGTESVITIAQAGASTTGQMHIYEYSGTANPAVAEANNSSTSISVSGSSRVTGTITTLDPGDLVFVASATNAANGGSSTGWWVSASVLQAGGTNRLIVGEYLPGSALTGFQDTASWNTARTNSAMIVAFKAKKAGSFFPFFT